MWVCVNWGGLEAFSETSERPLLELGAPGALDVGVPAKYVVAR